MAVPAFGRVCDAILNIPGHKIPTDNPQIAQPINDKKGDSKREIDK